MSRARECHAALIGRFPRVSGDEPGDDFWNVVADMFSPRERG